jgi:HK97 gp10 family phage protein
MAAAKGVIIEGLDELEERLQDLLPREARALLQAVTLKIAEQVRDSMKARAPVLRDPHNRRRIAGTLRNAIVAAPARRTKMPAADVRIMQGKGQPFDAYYWKFLEFGTRKMAAQPFAVPAVEAARPGVESTFRREFGEKLEQKLASTAVRRRLG